MWRIGIGIGADIDGKQKRKIENGGRAMEPINLKQKKKMYAIANALNLVSHKNKPDELHLMVHGMTGKESVKDLTYNEAYDIIKELEKLQGDFYRPKEFTCPEQPNGTTSGQQRKVWALMYQLERLDIKPVNIPLEDRLCGVIKKELKMDVASKNPFVWLTRELTNKLIEILKAYVRNAEKKAGAANGLCGQSHTK